MPDALDKLKELSQQWHEFHARGDDYSTGKEHAFDQCADELDALIPALEEDKRLAVATALGEAAKKMEIALLRNNVGCVSYHHPAKDGLQCSACAAWDSQRALIPPAGHALVAAHDAAIRAEVFDQFADIALSVYGIEAGTHTPTSLLQAVRERTVKQIQPWLLHDDECAKLTNDDGVKCTCGLDESVCALVKVGAR